MATPDLSPGTPKEKLRAMRILCGALVTGIIIFSAVIIGLKSTGEFDESELKVEGYGNIFLAIGIAVGVACFLAAAFLYKKETAVVRSSLISLDQKLNSYRATLIKYLALCEGAALLSLIFCFLTGYYYLLGVTAAMVIAMLAKWPSKQRVVTDLELDWKQQQELE